MEYNEIIKDSYYYDRTGMLLKGDCLEWMDKFPDKSVDLILCDLPYGTTACKWDAIIPFDVLWEQYERIIKDNGAIVLFGSEPFSSMLRRSNIKLYRYDWVWKKTMATLFQLANKRPMKIHENICVFYKHLPTYNPIMTPREVPYTKKTGDRKISGFHQSEIKYIPKINKDTSFPVDVIEFSNGNHARLHPTQKPVDLFEYLIKTYTNENEIVLDNTAGVCTTAIACKNTNRKWICIEKEEEYCIKSVERIKSLGQ